MHTSADEDQVILRSKGRNREDKLPAGCSKLLNMKMVKMIAGKSCFCSHLLPSILCLIQLINITSGLSSGDKCDRSSDRVGSVGQQVHLIEANAQIYFGALLNVHQEGRDGLFGCGNITTDGLIAYEALNWITSTLNQQSGTINGKKVTESFIPGVKIGKWMECVSCQP